MNDGVGPDTDGIDAEHGMGARMKAALAAAVAEAISRRSLTQAGAAVLCRTDLSTLSQALRGRLDLISLDDLTSWLAALGCTVQISVNSAADDDQIVVGQLYEASDGVDARSRAAAALQESEQRYRTLIETSPDAVHVHRDGVIILANRQAAILFGAQQPEELIGRTAMSLVDEASLKLARARTAQLRAPGDRNELAELTLHRLDGRLIAAEAASAAILLDGRPAVLAVLRDITERKSREAALRRSEERGRLALEAAGLGLWDVDYASGAASFDGRFHELFGFGPEEEISIGAIWDRIHPDDVPRVRAAVDQAKDPASGGGYEIEYQVVLPDGTQRWLLAKAQVHFEGEDGARRPARFLGVLMDLTERRAIEAALRDSETRYRATQEHAGVGISEVDAGGRFLRVNAAVCAITGYSREELLARTLFDVSHAQDATEERAQYAQLVAGEIETYAREKRYVRKDGQERWVEVAATAARDPAGRFRYGVRVIQDVTERKLAEARQRLLLNELDHRVKNTLAVVQALAAQSARTSHTFDAFAAAFEGRLGALARAHGLVTRVGWGSAELRALVEQTLEPYLEGNAGTVVEGPVLALPPGHVLSLAMVLHELATNAAKYGALSRSGGTISVSWRLDRANGSEWVCLDWTEAGSPEVRPPERKGFGTRLIEQSLKNSLAGMASLRFERDGLKCRLSFPLGLGGQDEGG